MKTKTWTIGAIRVANAIAGRFFFSPASVKFFNSKVISRVFQGPGGVFFVTSERFRQIDGYLADEKFTVREFHPSTGRVNTVGNFQAYEFIQDAKAAAALLAGRPVACNTTV